MKELKKKLKLFLTLRYIICILFCIIFKSYGLTFTTEVLQENEELYKNTFNMPFNQELIHGTLSDEKFKNYLIQDYIFLKYYKNVYTILKTKTSEKKYTDFISNAIEGVNREIARLHDEYFKKFNISKSDIQSFEANPATELYSSYLIKTAILEPIEVTLAAALPCSLIYVKIGKDMKKELTKSTKYSFWVDAYADEDFAKSTQKFINMIDGIAKSTTDQIRNKMKKAYKTSSRMEYMFWDAAYHNTSWVN